MPLDSAMRVLWRQVEKPSRIKSGRGKGIDLLYARAFTYPKMSKKYQDSWWSLYPPFLGAEPIWVCVVHSLEAAEIWKAPFALFPEHIYSSTAQALITGRDSPSTPGSGILGKKPTQIQKKC